MTREFDGVHLPLPSETEDAGYISQALVLDWLWNFCHDNKEYLTPRRFGTRAEYIEMARKLDKLEAPLLDLKDCEGWREPPRKVLMELISHAFLALVSLDKASGIDVTQARFQIVCVNDFKDHEHTHRDCWGITNGPD